MASLSTSPVTLKGVVFDMDGTLTVPCLDFAEMKRRVGITSGDILHVIDEWEEERRAEAYRIIQEMEEEAKAKLRIMPGAVEVCQFLDRRGIPRGLITRNVSDSVDHFHSRFEAPPFRPALSREFQPYKPHAAPLLHICDVWGADPKEVLIIGDSHKDDVLCGINAGALTCLLDERRDYKSGNQKNLPDPHFVVHDLQSFLDLLDSPAFEFSQ